MRQPTFDMVSGMPIDIIGFTGTQVGMTEKQQARFAKYIVEIAPFSEFHHGDCIGADEQAATMVREYLPDVEIVCHPPTNQAKRAFFKSDRYEKPFEYLERNHHIVEASKRLIACPKESKPVQRSGTWATYRYARARSRCLLTLIRPTGTIDAEEPF